MTTPIVASITDDEISEIERYLGFGEITLKVRSCDLEGLIARLRAAEKDAARYRWLRDRVGVDFAYGDFMVYLSTGGNRIDEKDKKHTDQTIDLAMEQIK